MNNKRITLILSSTLLLGACEPNIDTQSNKSSLEESTDNTAFANYSVNLAAADAADINAIAENLVVQYRVVTNVPSDKCQQDIADGNCFEVELTLTAKEAIAVKGWQVHFSQISPIQSFESDEFVVKHINGDLHLLSLGDNFSGFTQGQEKQIHYRAMFWSLSESDPIPNYIVSSTTKNGQHAEVIKSTVADIDKDTGLETLPFVKPFEDHEQQFKRSAIDKTQWLTPESLYQRNLSVGNERLLTKNAIIPTPKLVQFDPENRQLSLAAGMKIDYGNVESATVDSAIQRITRFGIKQNNNGVEVKLVIVNQPNKMIGSYQISVDENGIEIIGVDSAGVFNGLQTIASLLNLGDNEISYVKIEDEPHYEFRGLLVDVARNFHSKAFILKLLEQMAAYKLNKLHLHLGDDEGWRLEIPSLPELTQVSATRCFDVNDSLCLQPQLGAGTNLDSDVNGYYSVSDYQEILEAATARHIQVIPSLDMPGHSRAAIKAMAARSKKYSIAEQDEKAQQFNLSDPRDATVYSSVQFYNDNTINVCLESSYAFVHEVMTQVKQIHQEAGQPLTRYHIGADETAGAWLDSPACQAFVASNDKGVKDFSELGAYFIERVANILSDLDIETAGWSDGLEHTRKENMPAIVQSNAWDVLFWGGHEKVHKLANRGWQIVISSPDVLYFDFPYEADPKEHGYYWASRQTNTEKVFQFMPDNLPVHAEIWRDRQELPYQADDRKSKLNSGIKFLGIQGQLWSENTRSDTMAEYKIFPRLFALAERGWHKASWALPYNYSGALYDQNSKAFDDDNKQLRDQKWQQFANVIGQKALKKLEIEDVFYRLPNVGATIVDGQLRANVAFPGLLIEYQVGDAQWDVYRQPVKVDAEVRVRSRSFDGRRTSKTSVVYQKK
jgi:hexosaminidase